jgi:peptide/nickel transport system ATP-binding protein
MLSIASLDVSYRVGRTNVEAVAGVTFEVRQDEVFGLIGESGSGKSTLSLAILRLLPPSARITNGTVAFDGVDLLAMSERKFRHVRWEKIAYVPQGAMSALNPVAKIREQFLDVVADHDRAGAEGEWADRIDGLLRRVKLDPGILDRYQHQLSGGMRQRVCIALAMLLDPRLIIADEPTSALDVVSQRAAMETLMAERARLGASMLLVGHDLALLAEVTDRLGIMFKGRLVEIGPTQAIFNEAAHPYTRRLVGSLASTRERTDLHRVAQRLLDDIETRNWALGAELVEVAPDHYAVPQS